MGEWLCERGVVIHYLQGFDSHQGFLLLLLTVADE